MSQPDRILPPPYSLGQVLDRLPPHARRKYDDIRALLADAEVLQSSLMERLKAKEERLADLMRRRSYAADQGGNGAEVERLDGELANIRADLDRLDKERSRRNSVRGDVEQTLRRLDNFLMQKASGAVDVSYPPKVTTGVPNGRRTGESYSDALRRTRREIAAAQAELMRLKSAPPTTDEIKIAIIEQIDALAKDGRPLVTTEGGTVTINWPDVMQYAGPGTALSAPSGSASRLIAWVLREPLLRKLIAEVEDVEGGIPARERPEKIREMEERIFGLEIAEERLVMAALEQGLEVHRRIDASPWAILGYGLAEDAVPAEAAE
jgi:hypothetical protein